MYVTYDPETIKRMNEHSSRENNLQRGPIDLDGTYTITGIIIKNINGYSVPFIQCEGGNEFYADYEFRKNHMEEILKGKTLEVKSTKVMVTRGNNRYLHTRTILEVK